MTAHLTVPAPGDLNALMSANPPGMAWIAGTGPQGETCRTCAAWQRGKRPTYDVPTEKYPSSVGRTLKLKPRPCAEFTRLMRANVREVVGDPIKPDTPACRSFVLYDGEAAPLKHANYVLRREAEKAKAKREGKAPR